MLTGKRCPYCKGKPQYVDSIEIYGTSYGMIYLCRPCRAWVGVHKGTDKPLGRLANKNLRVMKIQAHGAFDNLWRHSRFSNRRKKMTRTKAYAWLSDRLGIPPKYTHIGMFSEKTCQQVIDACNAFHNQKIT